MTVGEGAKNAFLALCIGIIENIKGSSGKERAVLPQGNGVWPVDCPRVFTMVMKPLI